MSQSRSKIVTIETSIANDGDYYGISDTEMGGLVTRWCDCGDYDGGGDSETAYIYVDVACP